MRYDSIMYQRHYVSYPVLTEKIFQTYLLLTISIVTYLAGAYITFMYDMSMFLLFCLFALLTAVIITQSSVLLFVFSFVMGLYHNSFITYLNIINESIVNEALIATLMIFIGLTYISYKTSNYNIFAFYGVLYTCFSTIVWLMIFNIFYQNTLIDIFLMYASIVIFSGYIIYDTHNLLNNPHMSPVMHALNLFLDFINLFINLIKIVKQIKKKN